MKNFLIKFLLKNPSIPHSLRYNHNLDGLRGIAILLVILFHFFPSLFPFGFVGVDIFFVLSGYLITSILILKFSKGNFSFKEFYRNRIRRLFPALILILLFAAFIGWLFLLPDEYKDLGKHIESSAFYFENYRLINEIGYWDKEALYKPLLHLWSLSVEEQFYIIWPFLIFFLYKFNLLRIRILFLLFITLFGISAYYAHIEPVKSFYNTLTRSWELILGAIVALFFFKNRHKNFKIVFIEWKFLKIFIYIIFIVSLLSLYSIQTYKPLALLSILLVVSIWIFLVNFDDDFFLKRSFLIFLGLISYSLYLWHYLVLSFFYIFGWTNFFLKTIAIFISFLFAIFSFYFIELPFRKSKSFKTAFLLLLTLSFVGLLGKYIYINNGLPQRPIVEYVKSQLRDFARDNAKDKNCLYVVSRILRKKPHFYYCRSTTKDINAINLAIIGDSHAHVLYTGLSSLAKKLGLNVILLANSGCPPYINGERGKNLKDVNLCKQKINEIYTILEKIPNLRFVVFSTRIAEYATEEGFGRVEENFTKNPTHFKSYFLNKESYNAEEEFFKHLIETFSFLDKKKFKVFYILENPELGFNPKRCIKRWFLPKFLECQIEKEKYLKRQRKYREKILKIIYKNRYRNVIPLDLEDLFCDRNYCYVYKDEITLYADDDHISRYASFLVAKRIIQVLLKIEKK